MNIWFIFDKNGDFLFKTTEKTNANTQLLSIKQQPGVVVKNPIGYNPNITQNLDIRYNFVNNSVEFFSLPKQTRNEEFLHLNTVDIDLVELPNDGDQEIVDYYTIVDLVSENRLLIDENTLKINTIDVRINDLTLIINNIELSIFEVIQVIDKSLSSEDDQVVNFQVIQILKNSAEKILEDANKIVEDTEKCLNEEMTNVYNNDLNKFSDFEQTKTEYSNILGLINDMLTFVFNDDFFDSDIRSYTSLNSYYTRRTSLIDFVGNINNIVNLSEDGFQKIQDTETERFRVGVIENQHSIIEGMITNYKNEIEILISSTENILANIVSNKNIIQNIRDAIFDDDIIKNKIEIESIILEAQLTTRSMNSDKITVYNNRDRFNNLITKIQNNILMFENNNTALHAFNTNFSLRAQYIIEIINNIIDQVEILTNPIKAELESLDSTIGTLNEHDDIVAGYTVLFNDVNEIVIENEERNGVNIGDLTTYVRPLYDIILCTYPDGIYNQIINDVNTIKNYRKRVSNELGYINRRNDNIVNNIDAYRDAVLGGLASIQKIKDVKLLYQHYIDITSGEFELDNYNVLAHSDSYLNIKDVFHELNSARRVLLSGNKIRILKTYVTVDRASFVRNSNLFTGSITPVNAGMAFKRSEIVKYITFLNFTRGSQDNLTAVLHNNDYCRTDLTNVVIENSIYTPIEIRLRLYQQDRERHYNYNLTYLKYRDPVLQKRFSDFVFTC